MSSTIGENLVGSYLRYIRKCHFVMYNTQLPDVQGEIDAIGIRFGVPVSEIWFCEVVTHIRGLQYGDYDQTVTRIRNKVERAQKFAGKMIPYARHYFEIWSPVVPKGKLTEMLETLEASFRSEETDVSFVVNEQYTESIQQLVDHARSNTAATSEPAYRLLQILTRLKGDFRL